MKVNKKVLRVAKSKLEFCPFLQEYYGYVTPVEILQLLQDGWELDCNDKPAKKIRIARYQEMANNGEMCRLSIYFKVPKNSSIVKINHDKDSLK